MKRSLALSIWVALLVATSPAEATLTDSEKAQIREFYAEGVSEKAPRTRALLARPDLGPAEIREAFAAAAVRTPFDERRHRFVHNLLFGPASQASRSELVGPIVEGLLERAGRLASASGNDAGRAAELLRIHRFVAETVAPSAADPGGGQGAAPIRSEALEAVIEAYEKHLALPAMAPASLGSPLVTARAQAELSVLALAGTSQSRSDLAGWLTAHPEAKRALARTGVLVHGLAGAKAPKARAVAQMLEHFPAATAGTTMLWIAKPWPSGLSSSGAILVAQADLGGDALRDPTELWSSSVEPSSVDDALAEVAFVLARRGVSSRIRADATFAAATERALARAIRQGEAGFLGVSALRNAMSAPPQAGAPPATAVSPTTMLAHSTQLLLIDAPRALSLALARSTTGRFEPLEQLALALGVLATDHAGAPQTRVTLGAGSAAEGGAAHVDVTDIQGGGDGIVGFQMGDRSVRLTRTTDGAVTGVTIGGKPPQASKIPMAKTPTSPGDRWTPSSGAGVAIALFERMHGRAELGFPGAGRILARNGGSGAAAVVALTGASELRIDLEIVSFAPKSELVLRAQKGARGPAGVVLQLDRGDRPTARLFARDAAGREEPLGAPINLPKDAKPIAVSADLARDRLILAVGAAKVEVALPPSVTAPAHLPTQLGDLALVPPARGDLEIRGVSVTPRGGAGASAGGAKP